jgi:hypothetical protein
VHLQLLRIQMQYRDYQHHLEHLLVQQDKEHPRILIIRMNRISDQFIEE